MRGEQANLKRRALEHIVKVDQTGGLGTESSFTLKCAPAKPSRKLKHKTAAIPPINLKDIDGVNDARPDDEAIQRFRGRTDLEEGDSMGSRQ